jgi:hypothetical protein
LGETIPGDAQKIVDDQLKVKFTNKPYTFFPRAMYGIYSLVKFLKNDLSLPDDATVWITTNTESAYVSSCVTSAIEQTMPWTREIQDNTAVIFCIHEFGFPHPRLAELRSIADTKNIPLIEDCAYAWNTDSIGHVGDYSVYSLTKAFPLQFGSYVTGIDFDDTTLWNKYSCSDRGKREYTEARLASWIQDSKKNMSIRRQNYEWYTNLFGAQNTLFTLADGVEPGAYILKMNNENEMQLVSEFVRRFGIECGNYWQNSAITLPVHQRLTKGHLEYIAGAVLATKREWCGVPNAPE